jgi:hypothetical protein
MIARTKMLLWACYFAVDISSNLTFAAEAAATDVLFLVWAFA